MVQRIKVISIAFLLSTVAIIVRLFYWQIVKGGSLSAMASGQYQNLTSEDAFRGSILASDSSPLVASVDSWRLYVQKNEIKDSTAKIATLIAPITVDKDSTDSARLEKETIRIEDALNTSANWVPLKQSINRQTKKQIEDLKLEGVGFEQHEARYYPEGSSAAQLLGFVGKDKYGQDLGYFGLEGFYDLPLKGKPGVLKRDADALGSPILSGRSVETQAVEGVNLITHIDKTIQLDVESRLAEGISKYGAKEATVIMMDPKDGGVMAMASYPSYDPAKYFTFDGFLYQNPSISDSFEPGSIFKPLVVAAGIDAGVISADSTCDICAAPYKVDEYEIETWNNEYFANESMTDVIVHSDNVGMTFIGQKLGTKRLIDYIHKYGFGQKTGIDLQGEENPPLRKGDNWSDIDAATATFGQGIAVTPIQVLRGVAAIANGGYLVNPHIVDKVTQSGWSQDLNKNSATQIISKKAANDVKEMMVQAVSRGEAKWAAPKGFKIAGKTGTAQIPVAGHYDPTKTIASFVGFAPADNPRFVMLVTLKEPQSSEWGAETAAPLWFHIAEDVFPYLGIQPDQ